MYRKISLLTLQGDKRNTKIMEYSHSHTSLPIAMHCTCMNTITHIKLSDSIVLRYSKLFK